MEQTQGEREGCSQEEERTNRCERIDLFIIRYIIVNHANMLKYRKKEAMKYCCPPFKFSFTTLSLLYSVVLLVSIFASRDRCSFSLCGGCSFTTAPLYFISHLGWRWSLYFYFFHGHVHMPFFFISQPLQDFMIVHVLDKKNIS